MLKKFMPFYVLGLSTVMFGIFASEQGPLYEKMITKPHNFIMETVGVSSTTTEYKKIANYIEDDKQFLAKWKYNDKNDLIDVPIVIKQPQSLIDKVSIKLLEAATKSMKDSELKDTLISSKHSALGWENKYSENRNLKTNTSDNRYILIGVNAFTDENILEEFKEVFPDQKQLVSFVFYHEVGHYIAANFEDKNGDNALSLSKVVYSQIEKQLERNLSDEEKYVIITQYYEAFADVFAMQLMKERYPKMDVKETSEHLAYIRAGEITHLSSAAVLNYKEHIPSNKKFNFEDVIEFSRDSALKNIEYFSYVGFTQEASNDDIQYPKVDLKEVKINRKQTRERINKMFDKYEKQTKINAPSSKNTI